MGGGNGFRVKVVVTLGVLFLNDALTAGLANLLWVGGILVLLTVFGLVIIAESRRRDTPAAPCPKNPPKEPSYANDATVLLITIGPVILIGLAIGSRLFITIGAFLTLAIVGMIAVTSVLSIYRAPFH